DLMLYEYDGSLARGEPKYVVFPQTAQQVSEIVKLARRERLPIVPRGAGTGLSGGSIARSGGIILAFARMNRILEIDIPNLRATVQPGVVNLDLSNALAPHGFYFAPDPSSQKACTIGGNVAENSGGPHTLAYGVTVNHVTGIEVVLPDGRIVQLGGTSASSAGYPLDSAAVLLIELEGLREAVDEQAELVSELCRKTRAREVRRARDENERQLLWKGRKTAFGAIGRISPSYYVQDGVIPRTRV